MPEQYPSNEIHSCGFPEAQLLGNGATDSECAEISAAYLQGKPLPQSENEVINQIAERITQTSNYGKYANWGRVSELIAKAMAEELRQESKQFRDTARDVTRKINPEIWKLIRERNEKTE